MPKFSSLLVILFTLTLVTLGCKEDKKVEVGTSEISFKKEGELQLYAATSDSLLISLDIEIADSDYETQTGLMHRKEMASNRGMLFIFEEEGMHSFYMKNTLIPLDIIFLDKDLKVASIQKNAQPMNETSLPSRVPIQYVLEVNAGLTDTWELKPGDRAEYTRN